LTRFYWPGNVRELSNVIEATVCEVVDRQIEADDLPEYIRGSRDIVPISAGGIVGLTWDQLERMAIERTLQATGGNREQAAKMLGIGTRTLYRKIKEYQL
jgi:two-component system response regulator HydG